MAKDNEVRILVPVGYLFDRGYFYPWCFLKWYGCVIVELSLSLN